MFLTQFVKLFSQFNWGMRQLVEHFIVPCEAAGFTWSCDLANWSFQASVSSTHLLNQFTSCERGHGLGVTTSERSNCWFENSGSWKRLAWLLQHQSYKNQRIYFIIGRTKKGSKGFLDGNNVFTLLLIGSGERLIYQLVNRWSDWLKLAHDRW